MAESENAELIAYVDDVIEATSENKMQWDVVNPTTFAFDPPNHPGRIILQRVERLVRRTVTEGEKSLVRQVREPGYVWQVLRFSGPDEGPKTVVVLESYDNPQLAAKFKTLFEMIESAASKKRLDFLRSMLPKSK